MEAKQYAIGMTLDLKISDTVRTASAACHKINDRHGRAEEIYIVDPHAFSETNESTERPMPWNR